MQGYEYQKSNVYLRIKRDNLKHLDEFCRNNPLGRERALNKILAAYFSKTPIIIKTKPINIHRPLGAGSMSKKLSIQAFNKIRIDERSQVEIAAEFGISVGYVSKIQSAAKKYGDEITN